MATLNTLPPEILEQIFHHLPTHKTSIRCRSALIPLLTTSHYLKSIAEPLLNSNVQLRPDQAERAELAHSVSTLVLLPPSRAGGSPQSRRWTADMARHAVKGLPYLADLRLSGLESTEALRAVLGEVVDSAEHASETDSSSSSRQSQVPLRSLHLDFEDTALCTKRTSRSGSDAASDDGADERRGNGHIDEGSKLCSTLSLCCSLPALEYLRLSRLPRSSDPFLPVPLARSSLRRLELHHCDVSNEELVGIATQYQDTLQHLTLVRCGGFGRSALVEVVAIVGAGLKSLVIVDNPAEAMNSPSPPSPVRSPLSSPTPSHRTAPSTPARAASPSPISSSTTMPNQFHILDQVLPHTPSLRHLKLAGRLLSHDSLAALASHTPNLITLAIAACPSATPTALLPLLSDPTHRLTHLRRLEVDFHRGEEDDCAGGGEEEGSAHGLEDLWGAAVDRDVDLVGEFESIRRKVEWAQEMAKEVQEDIAVQAVAPRRLKRAGGGMRR